MRQLFKTIAHPCWVLALTGSAFSAHAMDLSQAFAKAKRYDPQFQAAQAELSINQNQATVARSTFLPSVTSGYSSTQSTANNSKSTFSVSQPILSAEKVAQYLEGKPLSQFAAATFATRELDLAQRLFTAVSKLVLANEAMAANQMRMQNLEKQAQRASRMYDLGQGSITDKRDVQVKYELARSNQLTLQINKRTAEMQIATLTGEQPEPGNFQLPPSHELESLTSLTEILDQATRSNPGLLAARSSEEVTKLEAKRAQAQVLPTLSLSYSKTWGSANNAENIDVTGLVVSMPLDSGRVLGAMNASASVAKAMETRRDAEEQTVLQVNQLYETVNIGREAVRAKRSAIEAAELSVEANTKSAQAGVRSTVEVLNAIDTLYQTKNDYAATTVSVAESLLKLLLASAQAPTAAIAQTQNFLFGNGDRFSSLKISPN